MNFEIKDCPGWKRNNCHGRDTNLSIFQLLIISWLDDQYLRYIYMGWPKTLDYRSAQNLLLRIHIIQNQETKDKVMYLRFYNILVTLKWLVCLYTEIAIDIDYGYELVTQREMLYQKIGMVFRLLFKKLFDISKWYQQ